jgi:hypothetical protein
MEITTCAKISTSGFKTFQQPCVREFLSKQFQVIMQLSGTQLKHYQLSKASKFCYRCSILIHCYDWESAGSPLGVRWKSARSPLGVRWESAGSPLGVRWESAGSTLGVLWESAGSPLGVRRESTRSPPGVHRESAGIPMGVRWDFARSPPGVHRYLNFDGCLLGVLFPHGILSPSKAVF